ncbi:MAG TPA: GNAT family N-acetyltransferase [Propionibacteriaceae bacterium]
MVGLQSVEPEDRDDLVAFLREVDLTLSGLDSPTVSVWVARDVAGSIFASTGFEANADGTQVLIRSVAVRPGLRQAGLGSGLARFALEAAVSAGAQRAWLFSRRSGPFWAQLGFVPADRAELARVLADTHQVRLFTQTGQLEHEVAWTRPLVSATRHPSS